MIDPRKLLHLEYLASRYVGYACILAAVSGLGALVLGVL